MTEDWQNGGFGLYIHWPFCEAKCPYCDFNSHVSRQIDQRAWRDGYLSELKRTAAETKGRVLNAVFFGGGTPSLMDPDVVADVISAIKTHWPTANDLEITLEANPSSVEAGRFAAYRDAGISRVSMGIQALNDEDLRRLGRIHTAKEALTAFDVARAAFDRVSFDLIYGRQNQTAQDWKVELRQALNLAIDHISLYQLTIEKGTAFGDRYARGGLRGLPDEDLGADLYTLTQDICDEMGMPGYEVSNHARDGAQSRHNLIYWRYGDYIGIGPGAHGRVTTESNRFATECFSNPKIWLERSTDGTTEKPRSLLDSSEQAIEFLLMGLRLKEGIDPKRFARIAGKPVSKEKIDHLSEIGMISATDDRIIVTNQGFNVLNAVIENLIPD
ncbi:coproporphyrinogen III oxidase [Sulfitobacter mediterraneus]|uniref:radical SAM family heme chaperone HemW n=1 Tax=Sulfitobacter mediterraneus TaxID=83219 RepID=UPI001933BB3B|nr:radical SAM family heme chaperone HemW [Sulfitobacter mediterraneus]MBM1632950.1 coproporphyrinogen III oxidase [Sulfitobacter mediterraneus]MBM1640916.1 coproporphyrinogen III oxidase [Sulfitobacter mediterraneus]MBM1644815.1 coproporphyrinogen III oxidase [Sulfitobacter mediterraneus]MBM1649036.1 coproporphyrinogen III oxidase [Sulfitobacter mediterraneus]MBM1653057.1 coproporphyrinogen III oxidase [Sulfitobacter mediterraneus]